MRPFVVLSAALGALLVQPASVRASACPEGVARRLPVKAAIERPFGFRLHLVMGVAVFQPSIMFSTSSGRVVKAMMGGRVTLLDSSGLPLLDRCQARGVSVLAAGVFNSGVLADPSPGAAFHYAAAPPDVLALAQRLTEVCESFGTTLAAAALHRPTLHPAVATVLVGASSPSELLTDLGLLAVPPPDGLWAALRACGARV